MKRNDIRAAYDATLPDEITRQRVLQGILSAASAQPPERETMKRKSFKRAALIALAAALVLGVTALAAGRQPFRFFVWNASGEQEIDALGEVSSVAFDFDGFRAYAEAQGSGQWVFFPDAQTFEDATGVRLSTNPDAEVSLITARAAPESAYVFLYLYVCVDGSLERLQGTIFTSNEAAADIRLNKSYYSVGSDACETYRYAPDRSAIFTTRHTEENTFCAAYFIESDIFYAYHFTESLENTARAKQIVDTMCGVK
ncbi:MAG: hypothetical protein IJU66_02585 [Oscillospiraceae bacterium]|nr:hypothetical protein [Oscillospiraceae bacterium]